MIQNFTAADVPDQAGKTFFITGANTGIGFGAATVLAGKGGRVLLGCRNTDKGRDAVARIADAHPGADVSVVEIDLADLDSVRRAAKVVGEQPRLDVLVNNAGIMMTPKTMTTDGFESQFGTNHLGHFALTGLLLPILQQTDRSRVVTVSSVGHRRGDINFDDISAEQSYSPQARYYQSKLANLLFTYELDRRLTAARSTTIAAAAHPGGADTELPRYMTNRWMLALMPLLRPLMNSADSGAWPTLAAATHPDVRGGQYFGPQRFEVSGPAKQVDSTPRSKDPALAARLWNLSIDMTGVDPGL